MRLEWIKVSSLGLCQIKIQPTARFESCMLSQVMSLLMSEGFFSPILNGNWCWHQHSILVGKLLPSGRRKSGIVNHKNNVFSVTHFQPISGLLWRTMSSDWFRQAGERQHTVAPPLKRFRKLMLSCCYCYLHKDDPHLLLSAQRCLPYPNLAFPALLDSLNAFDSSSEQLGQLFGWAGTFLGVHSKRALFFLEWCFNEHSVEISI